MKARFFHLIIAFLIAVSIVTIPIYALSDQAIVDSISTTNAGEYIPLDIPKSDYADARYTYDPLIFSARPEVFLSCYDWGGYQFGYKQNDWSQIAAIRFTDQIKSVWDSQDFKENFWTYVDSVITCAGISDTDSAAQKVRKAAIFIGSSYSYDVDYSESKYHQGIPFWTTLTAEQISFCMTDARLFMACCIRMSIPCRYLEGEAGGLHSWNRVYVNGNWSEVDVSFARKASNKDKYICFNSGRPIYEEIG